MAAKFSESEYSKILDDATECAHMIPSTIAPCADNEIGHDDACPFCTMLALVKTWTYLYRYFPGIHKLLGLLCLGSMDDPRNAMTSPVKTRGIWSLPYEVSQHRGKMFRLLI